ncbi:hypothetical protein ACFWPH_28495 [Nocardia sp. NPDC058499]|uniref:hypothetical protein n=1 Tax=Nocardia sp. NPDC058499 TaxID=3346530 RepID=UPI003652F859
MSIHYSTAVWPATDTGFDWDIPLLVLGGETPADIARIPLPTSLHRVGNEIMPYTHATMRDDIGPIPVSDVWIDAVETGYDNRAKVVIALDPTPRGDTTRTALVEEGVSGEKMPTWLQPLLAGAVRAATRDIPVSVGADHYDILAIKIDPTALTDLPGWANQMIGS